MDARSFATFLREKLIKNSYDYDEILLSATYETLEQGRRIAGIRSTLVAIADSLDDLLKEFHERNN